MRAFVIALALLIAPLSLGMTAYPAQAAFEAIEDFEDLILGPIDGQEGWTAEDTTSVVALDPLGVVNQVLAVTTESTHLCRQMVVPDSATRMVFFRFRHGSQVNLSFGFSELLHPTRFDQFDVELSLDNATPDLRINDAGMYRVLTTLQLDRWYNCWIQIDGTRDVCRIWLHARGSDQAYPSDLLSAEGITEFVFRNSRAGDLRTFYIKTGGGSGLVGPFFVDDLYREGTDEENLANPAANPASMRGADDERAALRLSVVPLPCRGPATIYLDGAAAGAIDLVVCDAQGRQVAVLPVGSLDHGRGLARWNRVDETGRPVRAGVYFVRSRGVPVLATRLVVVR